MTAKQFLEEREMYSPDIEDVVLEYTKQKCQELLLLVAEKAKIIDEDGDIYEQPHVFYCQGEGYETRIDKKSILNAVDLSKFIQ